MIQSKPYLRVVLTQDQREARIRSLALGLAASGLLVVVLLVAAVVWFDGASRWALLVATLVPLVVLLLAARGLRVLSRAQPAPGR